MRIPFNKNATQIKDTIFNSTFHLSFLLYSTMETLGFILPVKKSIPKYFLKITKGM